MESTVTTLLQTPLFIIFASVTLISLGSTLAHYWYKSRRAALDAELKMEMIQRGLTADEICRVIQARPGDDAK